MSTSTTPRAARAAFVALAASALLGSVPASMSSAGSARSALAHTGAPAGAPAAAHADAGARAATSARAPAGAPPGAAASARVLTATPPGAPASAPQAASEVHRVPVTGTIEMGLAPFVARALEEAAEAGAAAVVLDLDTPGGRVDAAWEIIDAVRDARVPVYAYVNRRALSAGAMIALSAERLYMRPGSTIGAATPVTGEGQKASEKMVSAMRSEFRALAEERGFDPRIAEAMVDESVEVEGVVDAGRLLTLTTEEAVELGVADAEVEDLSALLRLAGVPADSGVVATAPNWAENVVRFLTNPLVAPFLLSLGFLGLLVEIKTPTFGLAGAVGLLSLAAFFGARVIVNLAGLEELLLVGAGIVFLLAEVFVIPGTGIAGFLGGASLLAGIVMSFLGRFPTWGDLLNVTGVLALTVIIVAAFAYVLIRHIPYSRRLKGVLLRDETKRELGYVSAARRDELVGKVGVALTDLRPSGTAVVEDERIDVVTEGPWIEEGSRVRILRAEGYRHVVREVGEELEAPGEVTPPAP